ncbi:glycosyltransferase family 1 protein [Pseudomonas luteola]|uniref:glycosyltransferase family 4 protein n=1 Tax=Pseudomonas luteola TaxID=47886 RepID=UPI003A8955CD
MRLLIECTYVYEHPSDNSGIQRVVRNVIKQLAHIQTDVDCIPVIMKHDRVYQVLNLEPACANELSVFRQKWIARLERLQHRFWSVHRKVEQRLPYRESLAIRRLWYWPCRLASQSIVLPLKTLIKVDNWLGEDPRRAVPLSVQPDDHLVLLDSSWHAGFFKCADNLKAQGVGIVSVIYDLIPLTHPHYCDSQLVRVFDQWFNWVSKTADGFMSISKTISQQIEAEIQNRLGPKEAGQKWHSYFHLGSELDLQKDNDICDPAVQALFSQTDESVYLMVSTIEPRKNHRYLLDAFDLLWRQGQSVRLCIIGKIGWKCEDLVERIRRHPEFNRRLFMFNNLNDVSLEYAYAYAKALVFPSYVEGFGLPLVEAMQRGLPAMGSDIPVFREVGGEFMAYFDLEQPCSLARLVKEYEQTGVFPAERVLAEWQWVGWREATIQLVERISLGIKEQRPLPSNDNSMQPAFSSGRKA